MALTPPPGQPVPQRPAAPPPAPGQPWGLAVRPGLEAMAHPEFLPFFYPPGTQTLQFSSYDLTGGNTDGHFAKAFSKYVDDRGEHVLFDAYGPGTLYRQQLNIWSAFTGKGFVLKEGAGQCRLRYYFDDEPEPRIDLTADQIFGGTCPPFDAPFAFAGDWGVVDLGLPLPTPEHGTIFGIQYHPLPFARRLKVTFVPSPAFAATMGTDVNSWYQFTYLLYPVGTVVESWSGDEPAAAAVRAAWSRLGADPKALPGAEERRCAATVAAGATATLLQLDGQAAITALRLRLSPYDEDSFFNVRLRLSWDGRAPAVDMPIGVFFGGGGMTLATRPVVPTRTLATLLYGFDGSQGTFYAYWPMPFWRSARIEIVNGAGREVTVEAEVAVTPKEAFSYPPAASGYFHARHTLDADRGDALYAVAFREQGYGHVVGRTLYSEGYSMDGDEFTYIDGSRSPQVHGNGTEDDHNQGWGGGPYQTPLWGGVVNGYQGAYRLHLNDAYVFTDQIRIDYEHSRLFRSASGRTETVMYYYKAGSNPGWLVQTDSVDVGIEASEAAHGYSIEGETWSGSLRSAHDGYEKNVEAGLLLEEGRAFRGHSAFTVAVDPANVGVRLRRLLSRWGNGVQTADVVVDGVPVERPWHVVFNASAPQNQAWVESDFEIPAALTRGKSTLRIEVRYRASPRDEINEFHYWVFCHLPPRMF